MCLILQVDSICFSNTGVSKDHLEYFGSRCVWLFKLQSSSYWRELSLLQSLVKKDVRSTDKNASFFSGIAFSFSRRNCRNSEPFRAADGVEEEFPFLKELVQ